MADRGGAVNPLGHANAPSPCVGCSCPHHRVPRPRVDAAGNGDITASVNGIYAFTDGAGSITIDSSAGTVTGGEVGINAYSFGTGALNITTADVTGDNVAGINAFIGGYTTDLTVDSSAGSVSRTGPGGRW